MKILSYNSGHDGAIALLSDARLQLSIEAEKDSNYRYAPVSSHDVFNFLGELEEIPDVICVGGWWPREKPTLGALGYAGYRGVSTNDIRIQERRFLGKPTPYFTSTHERSHILCAFGMSSFPKGTPCYGLVWEGEIGSFYEIDSALNITLVGDVLSQPGIRYAALYGLADPSFPKNVPFSRLSDAGKLMALASFSTRGTPTFVETRLIESLLGKGHLDPNPYEKLKDSIYCNVGLDDAEFRNFAGIFSDELFDVFHRFALTNLKKGMPLLVAGGCGLNCDWNSKWRACGHFSEVFVPPVPNDSGSAIGTGIDAQFYFTGDPKLDWSVYSGIEFVTQGLVDLSNYDVCEANTADIAELLEKNFILGWARGKYEIGPRALGNRSILAAPFSDATRMRLNEIKQREQFRPIGPVCLDEDARQWFGCEESSPFMLYTYKVTTDRLCAVTHVNGTARLQTVSKNSNPDLYGLLVAFKARTGYGVLCNTSLNFNGRGFINVSAP